MKKVKETAKYLFESFLTAAIDFGKEKGKELFIESASNQLVQIGGTIMMDTAGAAIPGIGNAISSYRTNKKIANIEKMMNELNKRNEELKKTFEKQTTSNKKVLDDIFAMVVEKVAFTMQDEKIKYMIGGYSEILKLSNPSFDTAYLYFDTLDKMTILDIEALKESYPFPIKNHDESKDILEEFDIDYSQYKAVRENLYRMGLLKNDYDDKLDKDLENIVKGIGELRNVTESLILICSGKKSKIKKLTSKSNVTLKARDRLKISNFGRDFIEFFIQQEE